MPRRTPLGLALVLLPTAAAVSALVVSATFFPHLSINNDESVYVVQADALRHGHLFPPAPEPAESFRPWLSATDGHHYVTKYAPVHPAVIAAFMWLGLPNRAALAFLAAAAVLALYLLAFEVLGNRREALLAAALLGASPLFVVQSATFLPYVSSLLLLTLFAAALLRGARTGSRRALLAAGLLLGTAAFARPYDAALFAAPLLLFFAWRHRRRLGPTAWVVVGAAPPLLLMLLYFWSATGSPFRSPFQFLDAADTVGFGRRRIFPDSPYLDFDLGLGFRSIAANLHLLAVWSCGGILMIALAAAALRRRSRLPIMPVMAAVGLSVVAGYLAFWGAATALSWGGPFKLGPWYLMLVLVPLSVLAARGLAELHRHDRHLSGAAVVFMILFSGVVLVGALRDLSDPAGVDRRLWAAIDDARLDHALVFVPGSGLGNPVQEAVNSARLDAPVIWAVHRGGCADQAVIDRFPDRRVYDLEVPVWYRGLVDFSFTPSSILARFEARCTPWSRDAVGRAAAGPHGLQAAPAEIVTPGQDEPNAFVLADDGAYHLYSSQDAFFAPNISVRIGDGRNGPFGEIHDAMPELPPWAQRGFTWAPDVRRVGDRYVLWFSAATRHDRPSDPVSLKCIGVAVADAPSGPFVPVGDSPAICQRDRLGSIDPRTFADDDGSLWLHWKSDDNADVTGTTRSSIYAQRLEADGVTLTGTPRRILEADEDWEGRIVEAPQMVEAAGRHWLFYSGNWFNQPGYGIGVAECDGPAGPCRKPSEQPWLASNAQGAGPGENSLFRDGDGWWTVYAPWSAGADGTDPRPVALAPVTFGPDGPVIDERRAR